MRKLLVGATIAPHKIDGTESNWLTHADRFMAQGAALDIDVQFFLALELDARGYEPYYDLLDVAVTYPGDHWTFSLDDGDDEIDSDNRLVRICVGRNLVTEYAIRHGHDWILYLDTDLTPDPDTIDKLLEVEGPIVGGEVPGYCLSGPEVPGYGFPVETYEFNTAGYLLVERRLYPRLRWRRDPDMGMTDDPCYCADARALGFPTLVRKDCVGTHPPLVPLENRGTDRVVRRG